MEPTNERHLLEALASGDRRAAERLVDETYRQVFASLVRLTGGDTEAAADLTQETYRKAWKSLPSFRRRSQLTTWLYRIAYNTFLNSIRRPVLLQPIDEQQAVAIEDPDPDQAAKLQQRDVAERLRRAVIGLPEPLRFTISARFWGELAVEEIARQEQVTGAAIRKRLKLATSRLREALGEDAI